MTPQTVNAYYNPTDNTINFPAAILQPPFFDAKADDALNYGGIGAVIGHESSHGFDDQGSQFNGKGNRENWWTPEDKKKFEARTGELVKQFDAYTPLKDKPNLHVNGKLTLGENIADLGGINIAYDALQAVLKANPKEAAEKNRRPDPGPALLHQLGARLARRMHARKPPSCCSTSTRTRRRRSAPSQRRQTCRSLRKRSRAKLATPWCAVATSR